jgi:hypothetical protein
MRGAEAQALDAPPALRRITGFQGLQEIVDEAKPRIR